MHVIGRTPSAIIGAVVLASCSNPAEPSPSNLPACSGTVTVSASAGTTPTFTWHPACRAFLLLVEPSGSGADQWSIITDSTNGIAPPVTYGVAPAGTQSDAPPVTLIAGERYMVYLFRWTGPGSQDGELIGVRDFTP